MGCPPGTYQDDIGQAKCKDCDPSYMCMGYSVITPVLCKPGYYCPGGIAMPCPLGTFSNATGISSVNLCNFCTRGKYCSVYGLTEPNGFCAPGFFCEGAATSQVPGIHTKFPRNGPCPKGYYCPLGTQEPEKCPAGTFRNTTGAASIEACYPCEPGSFCEYDGLVEPSGLCAEGWYCPANQMNSKPSNFTCPEGHYCPEGTASPVECKRGNIILIWFDIMIVLMYDK